MIDNPEKTSRLLAALNGAVPFKVELVPSLVNYITSIGQRSWNDSQTGGAHG